MTLKEKVTEIMPEMVGEDYVGGVKNCPSSYDFLKGHYDIKEEEKMCLASSFMCIRCWNMSYIEDAEKTPDQNSNNVKVGAKWWPFVITNIDGNNVKYEYDDCIGSMPKEYLLTHCKCIDVPDINVGSKNEITLQEAKLEEIMKQLWQETENVLGNEMVDFYSIERIIRNVLGMDNSEEEK